MISATRRQISAIVPGWKLVRVVANYLYLGVWLGFDVEMLEWSGQMASIRHRTRFIASLGTGWSLSSALYSMLVSSLVPYVGQFRDLPTRTGNEECYAQSRVFRQPQAGVPRTALAALHALHPRVAISMFEHTQIASMTRAFYRLRDKPKTRAILDIGDETSLRALARPHAIANGRSWKPIFIRMEEVHARCNQAIISRALLKNTRSIQTDVLRDLELSCRSRANIELRVKLARMLPGATLSQASVLLDRVGRMAACLPGSAAGLFLRSASDAWATPGRFGAYLPCAFCHAESSASMRHFVACPSVALAVNECFSPLACSFFGSVEAFLAANQETPDIQVLGMFHMVLHALFMAVLKGGHCPSGAAAILRSSTVGLAARGKQFPSVARRLLRNRTGDVQPIQIGPP